MVCLALSVVFYIKRPVFKSLKSATQHPVWPFFTITRVNLVYTDNPPHLCRMENANNLGSSRPQGGTEPAAPSLTAQYMDWKVDWAFKKVFADRMNICVLELPRLGRTKPFDEMTDSAEKWAYMFQNIATFAGQSETVREFRHAMEVSRVDTLTPEEQNQYHDAMVSEYEKLVISEAYEQIGLKKGREEGHAEGRAEGIAEGRAEGMEQGKMEVARQMKKMGLSIAQIVQASGLPEDVVEGL